LALPWILKLFSKKGCILSFEWEKTKFTTLLLHGKILEKSPIGPPRKNPSDAHGCRPNDQDRVKVSILIRCIRFPMILKISLYSLGYTLKVFYLEKK